MLNGIYNIARRNSIQKRQNYGRKGERAISKKKTSALLFAVIFTAGLNAHSFSVNLQSDSYYQGDTIRALLKDYNTNLSYYMKFNNKTYQFLPTSAGIMECFIAVPADIMPGKSDVRIYGKTRRKIKETKEISVEIKKELFKTEYVELPPEKKKEIYASENKIER